MTVYAIFDVDGVINPYAAKASRRPADFLTKYVGDAKGEVWDKMPARLDRILAGNIVRLWYNPDMGAAITAFLDATGATPVWGTYWEELANKVISPLLGLPEFPTIYFPTRVPPAPKVHPKCSYIVDWVDGADFVWFDDETKVGDNTYFKSHHSGDSLVIKPNPAVGLTADHLKTARKWITQR